MLGNPTHERTRQFLRRVLPDRPTLVAACRDHAHRVPGALDAGLGDALFWGSLVVSLVVAFVVTVPVNRAMISRGKGHAVVHAYHHAG